MHFKTVFLSTDNGIIDMFAKVAKQLLLNKILTISVRKKSYKAS